MNCPKCGAELRSEQKVCIQCGARTAAGGNFNIEEKEAWRPTKNMMYAAGGAALLIIILIIAKSLSVVPPETVAQKWFDAMLQRQYNIAAKYHSPTFTSQMQSGISDTRAISDELIDQVTSESATYTFAAPTFDTPTQAKVIVHLKYPDREGEVEVDLAKLGRRWLISGVIH